MQGLSDRNKDAMMKAICCPGMTYSSAYGSCDNSKENVHMGLCSGSLVLVDP